MRLTARTSTNRTNTPSHQDLATDQGKLMQKCLSSKERMRHSDRAEKDENRTLYRNERRVCEDGHCDWLRWQRITLAVLHTPCI